MYYAPSNATISIVGDFDPKQAMIWVNKYFADLPRGKAIVRPKVTTPTLTAEKRLVFEDRVQVPRLYIRWPTASMKAADSYALSFLGSILTGSRTARLTKALVYDNQSAATVFAGQSGRENVGDFGLQITPRPNHTLAELEASTDSVLERLKREGPTAEEMAKAQAGLEFGFVSSLESTLGKGETLNSGLVFFGDPGYFKTQYARLQSVTAADVKRVANKYLGAGRVVLSIVPQGKLDQASKPAASTRVTVGADGGHYIMESR